MKLVTIGDLKFPGCNGLGGSSPPTRTIKNRDAHVSEDTKHKDPDDDRVCTEKHGFILGMPYISIK